MYRVKADWFRCTKPVHEPLARVSCRAQSAFLILSHFCTVHFLLKKPKGQIENLIDKKMQSSFSESTGRVVSSLFRLKKFVGIR